MELPKLILEKGEIIRKAPYFLFEFKSDNAERTFEMDRQAIVSLMRALPLASVKFSEAIQECQNDPNNKTYWSYTVHQNKSNCIKLEGSYFNGKAYMFLRPFFLPDPAKAKPRQMIPNYDVDNAGNNEIVMDDELARFERLLQTETIQDAPRWIPCKGGVQLRPGDIPAIQKFINQQLVVKTA